MQTPEAPLELTAAHFHYAQASVPVNAPDPAAQDKVARTQDLDLSEALAAAKLSQYEDALRELGCAMASDLKEVDEAQMMEMGMKPIVSFGVIRFVALDVPSEICNLSSDASFDVLTGN